jgi:CRP-like cAMP-binding protein
MMSSRHHSYNNRLLVAFPPADIEKYFVSLTSVSLSLRDVLLDAGAPIENVFFVEEGLACILTKMANGSTYVVIPRFCHIHARS